MKFFRDDKNKQINIHIINYMIFLNKSNFQGGMIQKENDKKI